VAEKNTPEGAQEQLESIEHAQKIKPNSIQDVSKSRQRFKTAVRKWLTGSSDLEPKD
jgi:hypothetical protein